jgi:hypothetical protein
VGPVERGPSVDELLDRAVAAINRGDRVTATALAGQVLSADERNADAEDLLAVRNLRRIDQVLESLRAGVAEGRQWFRPVVEARFGLVAWLRGEFDAAGSHLEAATAGTAAADQQQIEAVWFQPNDPIASAYIHLAFIRSVRADLAGAEAELALAARRVEQLGFPQGPFNLAYARNGEIGVRIEAGQLDRAAVLAAELAELRLTGVGTLPAGRNFFPRVRYDTR